jgi:hypothetical protein
MTAGSSHGPWRLSNSPALTLAFTNLAFVALGLPSLVPRKPSNPPNRRVGTRMPGGVAVVWGGGGAVRRPPIPFCFLPHRVSMSRWIAAASQTWIA